MRTVFHGKVLNRETQVSTMFLSPCRNQSEFLNEMRRIYQALNEVEVLTVEVLIRRAK